MIHVFIINPETGKESFGENLRKQLEEMTDITYYVFDTRTAGEEKQLVNRIVNLFEDDKIRIYCCGGSGTIRNIITGLLNVEQAEIAFYPNGTNNDFLKCFGDNAACFGNLKSLIEGEAKPIDYLVTNYGNALNAISVGQIFSKSQKYQMEIDGIDLNCDASAIWLTNGCVINGKLRLHCEGNITDGEGHYGIVTAKRIFTKMQIIRRMKNHKKKMRYEHILHGNFQKITIKCEDKESFYAWFDGELVEILEKLEITMKTKALHFVIPKGVELP